jgi:hypothetical protein
MRLLKGGCVGDCERLKWPVQNGVCSQENWREHDHEPVPSAAIATTYGTMSLLLRDGVRVDMTIDRAIRVIDFKVNSSSTHNKCGSFPDAL